LAAPKTKHWLEYEHFRTGLKARNFDFRNVDLVFLDKSEQFLKDHVRKYPQRPFFLYHSAQAVHLPAMPATQFVGKSKAGPLGDFIYEFDYIVGRLAKTLAELGVADNTLIIVTSDNGPEIVVTQMREQFGHDSASPWRGLKRDNWEGGHRVPFMACWPGRIRPGRITDQTICQTDLMATFAAIVGAKLPENAGEDSYNILPVLLGEPQDQPVRDYTLHQTISNALSIRYGPWKLLAHKGSGGNRYDSSHLKPYAMADTDPGAPGQLYNLSTDPREEHNLFNKYPEVVAKMKRQLAHFQSSGRSAPPSR
jgi:arylsulfatase A-like enzyme